MSLAEYAKRPLRTAEGSCTVRAAARQMIDCSVGALVITDASDTTPLDIVTDRDLVALLAEGLDPDKATLDTLARKPLRTIRADASLADAAHEREAKPRTMPFEEEERAPGLSKQARRRLAPELQVLLLGEDGASPGLDIVDGKLKVKVVLRNRSENAIRALEALGLRILQRTDDYAIARIPVAALARLAESEHVERIEPA